MTQHHCRQGQHKMIAWGPLVFTTTVSVLCLATSTMLGLFAVIAPRQFKRAAVNWRKTAQRRHGAANYRIQRDRLLLRRPRVFGCVLLLLSAIVSTILAVVLKQNAVVLVIVFSMTG